MKFWVAYLLLMFVVASRPGAQGRVSPRNITVFAASVVVAAALFQYRFI